MKPEPTAPTPAAALEPTAISTPRTFEAAIRGEAQTRAMTMTQRAAAAEDGRVALSFSSDEPILRTTWWGERYYEVLSHEPGAVDFSRAKNGLPYLVNHDLDQLIGRAEEVAISPDKKGRCVVRYSSSDDAQQIKQDVLDGIRPDVSVRYDVGAFTEELYNNMPLIRITQWTPLEVSCAGVPADASVGVGRSRSPAPAAPLPARTETKTTPETTTHNPATPAPEAAPRRAQMSPENTPNPAPATTAAAGSDNQRAATLDLMLFASANGVDTKRATAWVEKGITVDQARAELFDEYKKGVRTITPAGSEQTPGGGLVDLSDAEERQYSISRAINSLAERKDCLELEVSRAIGKKLNRDAAANGFFVPTVGPKLVQRNQRANPPMDTATSNHGKELVFTERGEFIELLRARTKVLALGARFLPGLKGNVGFPKQKTANTVSWTAENPGSAVTATDAQTDLLVMTPKQAIAQSSLTRTLLAQSTPAADQMIMADLAKVHGIAIDAAAINGTGSSGQPLGILNTSGIGSVAGGTNGLAPTWAHLTKLEAAIAAANADIAEMALLTTPGVRGQLKQTQQFASSSAIDAWTAWLNTGYRADVSTNVPSTLTKGSSGAVCHALIFGVWSELLIGEWGAFELIVDPYTQAGKGLVVMTTNQLVDVAVRHAAAFAAMVDALVS